MITFSEARARVEAEWPDYHTLSDGYEAERVWFVLLDPITIGGRIAAVDKNTGRIDWINENAEIYTQERPTSA